MANISDVIEKFLIDAIGGDRSIVINRNELADYFSCAPSQINYVLATRFTLDRGYVIQSRRGGGGCVTVIRISDRAASLIEIANLDVVKGLDAHRAELIVDRLAEEGHITDREAGIIKCVLSDRALLAPTANKDTLRASILKNVAAILSLKESVK